MKTNWFSLENEKFFGERSRKNFKNQKNSDCSSKKQQTEFHQFLKLIKKNGKGEKSDMGQFQIITEKSSIKKSKKKVNFGEFRKTTAKPFIKNVSLQNWSKHPNGFFGDKTRNTKKTILM